MLQFTNIGIHHEFLSIKLLFRKFYCGIRRIFINIFPHCLSTSSSSIRKLLVAAPVSRGQQQNASISPQLEEMSPYISGYRGILSVRHEGTNSWRKLWPAGRWWETATKISNDGAVCMLDASTVMIFFKNVHLLPVTQIFKKRLVED